jgi:hypothetical protein
VNGEVDMSRGRFSYLIQRVAGRWMLHSTV